PSLYRSRETLPGVLSRIPDTPLAGQEPAGTGRRRCHTASWRSSPPIRAARSLNSSPRRNAYPVTSVPILAARRDKTPFVRHRRVDFLVLLDYSGEAWPEHLICTCYAPAASCHR